MHHSTHVTDDARPTTRQKWQEPKVLIERRLTANAQDPEPNAGPLFGPFSTTTNPP